LLIVEFVASVVFLGFVAFSRCSSVVLHGLGSSSFQYSRQLSCMIRLKKKLPITDYVYQSISPCPCMSYEVLEVCFKYAFVFFEPVQRGSGSQIRPTVGRDETETNQAVCFCTTRYVTPATMVKPI